MSAVRPAYPNSVFTWTDRVNNEDIDYANDINSVASDLISVESTLGANPQIETNAPVGLPVTYPTVSARISDAMTNTQMPICELRNNNIAVPNITAGNLNPYLVSFDPHNLFNGFDLTIPSNGWWIVTATQRWPGWTDGYSHMTLCLNGASNIVDETLLNWEFPGNSVVAGVPGRWQLPQAVGVGGGPGTLRSILTSVFFQGLAHVGDRFSVFSENGTSLAQHVLTSLTLKASMIRKITGTFVSG